MTCAIMCLGKIDIQEMIMAKKRLTIRIEEQVIKDAKVAAVRRDTSLSKTIEAYLREWAKPKQPEPKG